MKREAFELLLVEDDPGDVSLTRELLKESKFKLNLQVVENGNDAISFVKKKGKFSDKTKPDLILIDLNLPRKNGYDVIKEIKSDEELKLIPIIAFTGSDSNHDIMLTKGLGCNAYLTKPREQRETAKVLKTVETFCEMMI